MMAKTIDCPWMELSAQQKNFSFQTKAAKTVDDKPSDVIFVGVKKSVKNSTQILRKVRCGECLNCLREDCGLCVYCLDKKKFGGKFKKTLSLQIQFKK